MAGRQTTLAIDLGGEQIKLRRVESVEGLSRPFQISVDLFSALGELDLLPHLGKPCTVSISEDGELLRYFNGFVTDGEYVSENRDGFHYRLTVRPWSHFLTFNSN